MKYISSAILFCLLALYCVDVNAQVILTIDNSSLTNLLTHRIILKEMIKAEAKLLKEKKVKKIFLKDIKGEFWSEKITFINKNGYIVARYDFDTLQTPDSEIRVTYDEENNPVAIYQYESTGENYYDFFGYEDNKISTILHLGDSAQYPLGEPFYADNPGEPLMTKVKVKRNKEDFYFINFKYNEAGKLIRVYEEGSPDTYKIKYEPDKITLTTSENESFIYEFKNLIHSKYSFLAANSTQGLVYTYKFNSNGLRESITMAFNGESYTQFYEYEFYK